MPPFNAPFNDSVCMSLECFHLEQFSEILQSCKNAIAGTESCSHVDVNCCSLLALGFIIIVSASVVVLRKLEIRKRRRIAMTESSTATTISEQDKASNNSANNKLSGALGKARRVFSDAIGKLFTEDKGDFHFDELEELLISFDVGVLVSKALVAKLREHFKDKVVSKDELLSCLRAELVGLLTVDGDDAGHNYAGDLFAKRFEKARESASDIPVVILVVGINGSGKTTTIGKLANYLVKQNRSVLLAACDTFRAAAREQLEVWSGRVESNGAQVAIVMGDPEQKPSTVAYMAVERAIKERFDCVLIDTAGRLHNRSNLMNELEGVVKVIRKLCPTAPHEVVLIVDGSLGQNSLEQAREFGAKVGVTGLVVTKLDGTARGGAIVAIKHELGLPVYFIGVGERSEDLIVFSPEDFVASLLDGQSE